MFFLKFNTFYILVTIYIDIFAKKTMETGIRKNDIFLLFLTCIISGVLILIPEIFYTGVSESVFYQSNAPLIAFFGLTLFTLLVKDKLSLKLLISTLVVFSLSAVYINLISLKGETSSVILARIHLPLMLWCLYGLIFTDFKWREKVKLIDFLRYNGELAILLAVIMITGGIMVGLTIALFQVIDINVTKFYFDQIALVGVVSVPILATFIANRFPEIAAKIAPVVASIFSPMVLIILIFFLGSLFFADKDPFNDRNFLLVFNFMLLAVMALIVFSVSETATFRNRKFGRAVLLALTLVTLIVDIIALSAIIYRLGEFGLSPNRFAVLATNILIFGNILLIMIDLIKVNFKNKNIEIVEKTIAGYLPVYAVWTVFAVFLLPLIFGFK